MATTAPNSNATLVCGVERSLGGRSWRWRGGPNQYDGPAAGLGDDILTQLLLARGVARDDLERQREPKLAAFLPDPAIFQDMEAAAERLAQAILTREKVTIYGDYDVDGATSAALLIRLFGMLGHEADYYIPDRLLEGYGPSGEALVKLGEQGSSLVVTVDCGAMAHEALAAAPSCPLRVSMWEMSITDTYTEPATFTAGEPWLTKAGVKLWTDGSPWVGNIAISFPYLDTETTRTAGIDPATAGGAHSMNYSRAQLDEILDHALDCLATQAHTRRRL